MPVVKPSQTFQGSKITTNSSSPWLYIRQDVPQVDFGKEYPSKGKTFLFLPAYRTDEEGNGVWYKSVSIRSDFGTGTKGRANYYIPNLDKDPGTYFERQLRAKYPDLHRAQERTDGFKGKVYPACGRQVNRVIYNVVEYASLKGKPSPSDVIKVANVPSNGIADKLDSHMRMIDPVSGITNSLICDPEGATPVTITKNTSSGGNPWTVSFSTNKINLMTPSLQQYADMDNLINLDDIFIELNQDDIIEQLRSFFDPDVFADCIDGFVGYKHVPTKSASVVKTKPKPAAKVEEESDLPDLSEDFKEEEKEDDIPFDVDEDVPDENPIKKAPASKMKAGDISKYLRAK